MSQENTSGSGPGDETASAASKPILRELLRARRRSLSQDDREAASLEIVRKLHTLACLQAVATVSGYRALPTEPSIDSLLESWLGEGVRVLSPRVGADDRLELCELISLSHGFTPGKGGILEPAGPICVPVGGFLPLDAILIPGIGFDLRGFRLGSGRGHFDRLLPQVDPSASRIGVAFECQVVPALPVDPWDQRIDVLVTEQQIRAWPPRSSL